MWFQVWHFCRSNTLCPTKLRAIFRRSKNLPNTQLSRYHDTRSFNMKYFCQTKTPYRISLFLYTVASSCSPPLVNISHPAVSSYIKYSKIKQRVASLLKYRFNFLGSVFFSRDKCTRTWFSREFLGCISSATAPSSEPAAARKIELDSRNKNLPGGNNCLEAKFLPKLCLCYANG